MVEVCAAVVVVVVGSGVCGDAVEDLRRYLALDGCEEVAVGGKFALLGAGESVEADVLSCARASFIIKCVGDAAGAGGYASPDGLLEVARIVVHGQSALVELLAVAQHVLRHLAEVEVEFAAVAGVAAGVEEGVEHPELDVLVVLRLEVGVLDLAHHASPFLLGVGESSLPVEVGVEVVGTALRGVVGEVEHVQRCCFVVAVLPFVGVEVALIDFAYVAVGELVEVALDVSWCE